MHDGSVVSLDISELLWTPAGSPIDPDSHLMTLIFFGKCPMVLHAVEVLVDRHDELIAKCEKKQHLVFGAEVVAGGPSLFRRINIRGREYVLIAVPTVQAGGYR